LKQQYPQWQVANSSDAAAFAGAVRNSASEPLIVEYSRSFFPVLAAVFVLRSFLFEPFQIPSSSMVPTLEVGDYILVNKFTYGIRLPVVRHKVVDIGSPERGDVIEYRNKQLSINGIPAPTEWLQPEPGTRPGLRVAEEQIGGDDHLMQIDTGRPSRDFAVRVKPGHYFMMGDNRDNSSDSRVWGQVPEEDIVGKAVAVWMHWESFFSVPSFGRTSWIQ
jgi:signal peptidase I